MAVAIAIHITHFDNSHLRAIFRSYKHRILLQQIAIPEAHMQTIFAAHIKLVPNFSMPIVHTYLCVYFQNSKTKLLANIYLDNCKLTTHY